MITTELTEDQSIEWDGRWWRVDNLEQKAHALTWNIKMSRECVQPDNRSRIIPMRTQAILRNVHPNRRWKVL